MNILEFVSTLIGQLISWPVAIIVVALVFQKEISELISRIRSGEAGFLGLKVEFGDRLAQTEKSVDQAVESIEHEAGEKQRELPAKQNQDEFVTLIREAAEANPSYVVLAAWEQLTGAINDLIGASLGTEGFLRRNFHIQLRELQQRKVINKEFAQAVNDLRDLRNRVAHGQHNPTSGEAIAYAESAKELTKGFHTLADLATRKRSSKPPTDTAQ